MFVTSGDKQKAVQAGGSDPFDPFHRIHDAAEVRRVSSTITCIPACREFLRVLVVDDERDTADSMGMLVKMWGHDVDVAYSGASAIQLSSACPYDVLLLDFAMPHPDGRHVAQHLRRQARFKDTLLVGISGYADESHRRLGMAAGFDHYLVKPIELSTLNEILLLEQKRLVSILYRLQIVPLAGVVKA